MKIEEQKKKSRLLVSVGKFSYSIVVDILASALTVGVVASIPFLWEFIKPNVALYSVLFLLIISNIWLLVYWIRHRRTSHGPQKYSAMLTTFLTLVSRVENKLMSFVQSSSASDASVVYVLHWVPTFALSRGLKSESDTIIPADSPTYCKLRSVLQETRGKILCYDGAGIYRFLEETKILYNDPLLVASYLDEVINVLNDNRITVGFLKWGTFPYTFIALGDHYAVFDFTSMYDIWECDGFRRSSSRLALRLEVEDKEEIRRVRNNMFIPIQRECDFSDELREKSIEYLAVVAQHLRKTKRRIMPDDAEKKYWFLENAAL